MHTHSGYAAPLWPVRCDLKSFALNRTPRTFVVNQTVCSSQLHAGQIKGRFANCLIHSVSLLKEEMLLDVGSAGRARVPLATHNFITKLYFPEEICSFLADIFLLFSFSPNNKTCDNKRSPRSNKTGLLLAAVVRMKNGKKCSCQVWEQSAIRAVHTCAYRLNIAWRESGQKVK